jgi:hypothetical protein
VHMGGKSFCRITRALERNYKYIEILVYIVYRALFFGVESIYTLLPTWAAFA